MDALIFDTSALLNFGQRGHLQPLLAKFGRVFKLLTTHDVLGEGFRIPESGANQTFAEYLAEIE